MSKVLSRKDAEEYIRLLCLEYGFVPLILDIQADEYGETHRLCNSKIVKKTKGLLWWTKTVEVRVLDPVFTGRHWEDCIQKFENWIETQVKPRIEKAEKQREKLATMLLDEELKKKS